MKKLIALIMSAVMIFSVAACGSKDDDEITSPTDNTMFDKSEGVMTYSQYDNAGVDTPVVIEAFVQAKQTWWDNKATIYLADPDGAYFAYNMVCSEQEYAQLTDGQKIRISGVKSIWAGEEEIIDGTFELCEGTWLSTPVDLTSEYAAENSSLSSHMNQRFRITNAKVTKTAIYEWDGTGTRGNDLYFKAEINGSTFDFVVESYLCGAETAVYQTVEGLQVGQTIDMEGFLYWYEGPCPHITSVTVK